MDFWLLLENRNFRPQMMETSITKYTLPQIKLNTACNDVLNNILRRLWWTQLIIEF